MGLIILLLYHLVSACAKINADKKSAQEKEAALVFFQYGEKEMVYLKKKDKKLGEVIERIGYIQRPVDTDLFASVVHSIVGQQISTKAQQSIWRKMNDTLGKVDAKPYWHWSGRNCKN